MFRQIISLQTFITAAKLGKLSNVQQYILENRNNPAALNATYFNGDTALHTAVMHQQEAIFNLLLKTVGVNMNAANQDGNTPLITAVTYGRTNYVNALLKQNEILINAMNQDGFTALSKAAMYGHIEIVKLLLAVPGIDLSLRNIFHRTAAEEAIVRGQDEIACLIHAADNLYTLKDKMTQVPILQHAGKIRSQEENSSDTDEYENAESCTIC